MNVIYIYSNWVVNYESLTTLYTISCYIIDFSKVNVNFFLVFGICDNFLSNPFLSGLTFKFFLVSSYNNSIQSRGLQLCRGFYLGLFSLPSLLLSFPRFFFPFLSPLSSPLLFPLPLLSLSPPCPLPLPPLLCLYLLFLFLISYYYSSFFCSLYQPTQGWVYGRT